MGRTSTVALAVTTVSGCLYVASCCSQHARQFRFVGASAVLTTLAASRAEPQPAGPSQDHQLFSAASRSGPSLLGLATCQAKVPQGFLSNQASAVAIGPRTVLTAAHVLDLGAFEMDGIRGDCTAAPGWDDKEGTGDDLALCRMKKVLWRKEVAALDLSTKVETQASALLVGNGGRGASCERDGVCARAGSVVEASSGIARVRGCFCPGDSGGPVFMKSKVVGIMAETCKAADDTSVVVLVRRHESWIRKWAKKKGNEICGINSSSNKCPAP